MASGRTGTMEKGTYIADPNEQPRLDDEQNIHTDNANADDEALGIKREKRLNTMCICSMVTIVVSLLAIVVGILALTSSGSKFPYILSGGAIAGGMALIFTICPLCMYCEGKKTKSGNKMTSTFQCCIVGLLVWLSFSICGIAIAWGMSGVWGMVECLQEKQMPGSPIYTACADRTDEKLVFSVLTFVLSSVLLILLIVISCIFCCNTKAFGYKTVRERRYEFYVRNIARDEIEREINAQRNQRRAVDGARGGQETSVAERRFTDHDSYNHHTDTGASSFHGYAPANDKRQYDNRENERHREPSAPPAEINDHRDRRPYHDRNNPPRPHHNDGQRIRPGEGNRDNARDPRGQRSRRREHERRDERTRKNEIDSEAPPPSYDEVVDKYLKADDV